MNTFIRSIGTCIPDKVVTSDNLEEILETKKNWIVKTSGIESRHWISDEKTKATDLGFESSVTALEKAGWDANDVDLIIYSTETPDVFLPGSGCILQGKLDLESTPTIDIRQQCTGFIYGLSMADAYIKSGIYNKILLVCAEVHSPLEQLSEEGRGVAVLFADGAASICIEGREEEGGIIGCELHSGGKYYKYIVRPTEFDILQMHGKTTFRRAVKRIISVVENVLDKTYMTESDIDLMVPHQANLRINETVREKINFPSEKVYNNIQTYGNTASASIPIALEEAFEKYPKAKTLLFAAYGGGETWAAMVYKHR